MPRRGVIDVGTNSVKVLVGDVEGDVVVPVWETSEQTRLGRGFYDDHRLQAGPIAATAQAVARFAAEARARGAGSIRVVATSAARDAVNREELLDAVRRESGLGVEVISGETEAEWGFRGVMTDPAHAGHAALIVDVGGGSTEFMLGDSGRMRFRRSHRLGSVRLHERFAPTDPPQPDSLGRVRGWLRTFLADEVAPGLRAAIAESVHPEYVVGVGGTTSIMAMMAGDTDRFDRGLVESAVFDLGSVRALLDGLWSEPLEVRRRRRGLPPERADVIPFGVAVYEAVLETFGLDRLRASTRGLRFAALLEAGA